MPVLRLLGRITGTWLWLLPTRSKQVTQINIDLCFPDKTQAWKRNLVKQSLIETAITACEIAACWIKPVSVVNTLIESIEGESILKNAQQLGKGVVLLAPHLGNWELLNFYLATHYPMEIMYAPPKQQALDPVILEARKRAGAKLVPANRRGVLSIFKHLKSGGITGILPDQEPPIQSGVFAPFFGIKTLTPTLVSKLIRETQSVAIGVACYRQKNGRFSLRFSPCHSAIYDENITISAGALNRTIQDMILLHPEQYQWEYKRFKRRPQDENKIYPKN